MPYPYVLLSAAVSLDGYLDDTGPERLLLSSPADFDRVDEVRASVDAILVGAGTLRADNPRLLVNSPERRAARVADGRPEYPLKVTVSGSGTWTPRPTSGTPAARRCSTPPIRGPSGPMPSASPPTSCRSARNWTGGGCWSTCTTGAGYGG